MNYLGKYLKKRLKQLKMSEREISGKCGLSHSYLNQLIKGLNPTTNKSISPTLKTFEKLSLGFDVPVEILQKTAMGVKENRINSTKEENKGSETETCALSLSEKPPEKAPVNKSRRGRKKKTALVNSSCETMGCSPDFLEQIRFFQSFMSELGFNKTKKTEDEWILIMSGIREALRKYIAKNKCSARRRVPSLNL